MDTTFFDLLGGPKATWHFQTFDDKKEDTDKTGAFSGSYTEVVHDQLCVANKHGAGIFVAVNEHKPKKPRTKVNTVRIRALFLDFDNLATAKESLKKVCAVLAPTMIVESSPGKYHVYYVLHRQDDILVSEFATWQAYLAREFGSDPKIKDPSRVMRVPGFKHNKGDPFETVIVECSKIKYGLDDLVGAFYGGRNNWMTAMAGRFRDEGLARSEMEERLSEANSRLQSPLDDDEVMAVAASVERYKPDPEKEADYKVAVLARDLRLETNKNGNVLPNISNLRKLIESDPSNQKIIWTNVFNGRIEVAGDVPWKRHGGETNLWSDNDDVSCRLWFIRKYGDVEWGRLDVRDLLVDQASVNHYDPLRAYFKGLEWDGVKRVEDSFTRHLAADDSEWTRAVARNFFIGAVRRALEPGCQHDEMVVFFGEEGTGKSSFSRFICPEVSWFSESIGDLKDKDSLEGLRGKWIVELGELKSLQGANSEHIKSFLTTIVDNYRPSYGRYSLEFPRRCVFFGTTNNPKFLSDSGINRRFLPLEASGELDQKALIADRDQLWAEAHDMYKRGVSARVPRELYEEASTRRLVVTEDGGYTGDIIRYLEGDDLSDPPTVFIPREFYLIVVEHASRERWSGEASRIGKQIANAAKIVFSLAEYKDRWKYSKFRHGGSIVRAWRKSND